MEERLRLLEDHLPPSVTTWSLTNDPTTKTTLLSFTSAHLVLQIGITPDLQALTLCQLLDTHLLIPRRQLDPLRAHIRDILHSAFTISPTKPDTICIAVLQALEAIWALEITLEAPKPKSPTEGTWTADGFDWSALLNNPRGLDVSSIRDTAFEILQQTPEQLVAGISPQWRVVHIESVLRPPLVSRFWRYRAALGDELQHSGALSSKLPPHSPLEGRVLAKIAREDIVADMLRPRVTFHGTVLKNVGSIVRHGFQRPGRVVDGKVVASPRSGIAFDRGIYSSHAASYALSYAAGQSQTTPLGMLPSMRLFVCATIMGRTYRGQDGQGLVHGPQVDGYDSHFNGGFEYIVHDEAAMLPCYVIHLDLGSEEAKRAVEEAQRNPFEFYERTRATTRDSKAAICAAESSSPGDLKRAQEARKAAAMKWFPYGFGPATGTRFVIEEIGEASDDEEEYGDWQAEKHGFVREDDGHQMAVDETYDEFDEDGNVVQKKKGLFLDQYQHLLRG